MNDPGYFDSSPPDETAVGRRCRSRRLVAARLAWLRPGRRVLGWIAGNAGLLVDCGKDLATTAGTGKEIGNVVDGLNVSRPFGQVIAVLRVILKPLVVIFWAIGALALIAARAILPKLGRRLATGRH